MPMKSEVAIESVKGFVVDLNDEKEQVEGADNESDDEDNSDS